jgi:hypothetical protein
MKSSATKADILQKLGEHTKTPDERPLVPKN